MDIYSKSYTPGDEHGQDPPISPILGILDVPAEAFEALKGKIWDHPRIIASRTTAEETKAENIKARAEFEQLMREQGPSTCQAWLACLLKLLSFALETSQLVEEVMVSTLMDAYLDTRDARWLLHCPQLLKHCSSSIRDLYTAYQAGSAQTDASLTQLMGMLKAEYKGLSTCSASLRTSPSITLRSHWCCLGQHTVWDLVLPLNVHSLICTSSGHMAWACVLTAAGQEEGQAAADSRVHPERFVMRSPAQQDAEVASRLAIGALSFRGAKYAANGSTRTAQVLVAPEVMRGILLAPQLKGPLTPILPTQRKPLQPSTLRPCRTFMLTNLCEAAALFAPAGAIPQVHASMNAAVVARTGGVGLTCTLPAGQGKTAPTVMLPQLQPHQGMLAERSLDSQLAGQVVRLQLRSAPALASDSMDVHIAVPPHALQAIPMQLNPPQAVRIAPERLNAQEVSHVRAQTYLLQLPLQLSLGLCAADTLCTYIVYIYLRFWQANYSAASAGPMIAHDLLLVA